MCVIAIARTHRMTKDHVKRMWSSNRDGGGIGYRENGRVQWRKGLDEEEMENLVLTVPLPYVAHFRIASCGGVREELTHPFPITKEVPLALKGSTSGYVLFHNGHYGRWRDTLMQMATSNALKVPTGPWSDSRLMAWVAAHCTINILPHFDEKLVAFGLNDLEIYGAGWSKVDDLYVSNRSWEHHHTSYTNITVCRFGQCRKDRVDNTIYCEDHQGGRERTVFQREDDEKDKKKKDEAIEAAAAGVRGVAPIPRSFRRGHNDAGAGGAEQAEVEEVEELLRGGGTPRGGHATQGEVREGEKPTNLALEAGNKMIGWVRALNPRAVSAATPVTEFPETWD